MQEREPDRAGGDRGAHGQRGREGNPQQRPAPSRASHSRRLLDRRLELLLDQCRRLGDERLERDSRDRLLHQLVQRHPATGATVGPGDGEQRAVEGTQEIATLRVRPAGGLPGGFAVLDERVAGQKRIALTCPRERERTLDVDVAQWVQPPVYLAAHVAICSRPGTIRILVELRNTYGV